MAQHYLNHVSGDAAAVAQARYYGHASRPPGVEARVDHLGTEEIDFIARRDSFYLASVSDTGWPYVQHRGGPTGFLEPLSDDQLAFLDFRGNRQLLTTGNVTVDSRVSLFLMDYPRRERLKILGHMRVLDPRENSTILARLRSAPARSQPERIVVIDVVSFDWNCPKFITPRYTAAEIEEQLNPLRQRINELETQLSDRNR